MTGLVLTLIRTESFSESEQRSEANKSCIDAVNAAVGYLQLTYIRQHVKASCQVFRERAWLQESVLVTLTETDRLVVAGR